MLYVGAAAYILAPGAAIGAGLNVVANGATINSLLWPAITSLAGAMAGLLMTPGVVGASKPDTQTLALKIGVGAAIGPYFLTRDTTTSALFAVGAAGYYYYISKPPTTPTTTTA
jgi:hypothetical protein